jgi:tetratricopeptide (TPR) repeat protein
VLASAWHSLAGLLSRTDRLNEAEDAFRRCIGIKEALAAEFPDIPRYQQGLATGFNNLGIVYRKLGRPKEWEDCLRKAIAIQERIADLHPEVPDYRHVVTLTSSNLLNILWERKELREYRRIVDQLLPREKALADAYPRNRRYSITYFNLVKLMARVLLALGDHAAAARCAEGLAQWHLPQDAAGSAAPVEAGWWLSRCAIEAEREAPLARREETKSAYVERARVLFAAADRSGRNDPGTLAHLAYIFTTVEIPELRDTARALNLARRSVELDPKLAFARTALGLAECRSGHGDAAIAEVTKGVELSGGRADSAAELILALAHAKRGDLTRARQCFDRADRDRRETIKTSGGAWEKGVRGGADLQVLYDEAAALLGVNRLPGEAAKVPVPGPEAPPR